MNIEQILLSVLEI